MLCICYFQSTTEHVIMHFSKKNHLLLKKKIEKEEEAPVNIRFFWCCVPLVFVFSLFLNSLPKHKCSIMFLLFFVAAGGVCGG